MGGLQASAISMKKPESDVEACMHPKKIGYVLCIFSSCTSKLWAGVTEDLVGKKGSHYKTRALHEFLYQFPGDCKVLERNLPD